jgi:ABC-type uncharacterized transport system permease subunit
MGVRYTPKLMIVLILFTLPAVVYGAVWFASLRWARRSTATPGVPASAPPSDTGAVRWLVPAAILLHGASLAWPWNEGGFHFGFAKALSATLWIGLVLLWFEGRKVPLEAMRLLVLPLAGVLLLLPLAFPGGTFGALAQQPLFVPHLLAGTLAYGVLLLAALVALLMLWVQRDLQRPMTGTPSGPMALWIGSLPPLMVLERILFRFIGTGFVLLLLTTLSGMLFSEEVFGRPFRLEHKTVFSVIALGVFGVLLAGRAVRGWRGKIATRFTLGGFAVLLLAYVGTRFVLEVVLRKF